MPVLDLDDFLKKNAQKAGEPQAPAGPTAAKPVNQSPFSAFSASQPAANPVAGDLLDFRQKTEGTLTSMGQDVFKLSGRVSALERNAEASQAKTEQLIAIIDRVQPDRISSEISDIRSQLSGVKSAGAPAMQDAGSGVRVSGPDVSGAVRRLETEYIEMSSKLRPMEVALEQLKAWADRDKEYFIKTDDAHNKLSELERKIALKSDYPSEQILSRAQFDKYAKMTDMDRQQLRLSVDALRDTVSQISASVDRLNSMAVGGHQFYSGPSPASAGLEAKVDAHEKAIAEMRSGGLDKYSKELEKTRAEVSANYEQVKAVERLLTAQSNKMQAVFSEIQKNLSEYKLTSDTINSTHEAVLHDISSLKAEHEHGIEDYRRIAAELSQKVEQNAAAVLEMRLMVNGLHYTASKSPGAAQPSAGPADMGFARAEQKRLLDETNALSETVTDLAKKAAAFQEQAAKIASMEETVMRVERKVIDSEANNAALFANITTGFSELKSRMEGMTGESGFDPVRLAVVEKGFADLGEKVNSIEYGNASLFANLSKSVSRLKAQVDSLQTASPSSSEATASTDGRIVFASTAAVTASSGPDTTLLSRIDALEKSITALKAATAPQFNASTPVQFNVTPESIGSNLQLFETRLAYLESFKRELDAWKEQADGMTEKVDSLYSSHAQLVQEVASVISEKQSDAFTEDQVSKAQAEESKELLNELKVQTELLSSKFASIEGNVSAIVGQRFSQLQTQSDKLNAEIAAVRAAIPQTDKAAEVEARQSKALAAVDAKLTQAIDDRFMKAQQSSSQQYLEFAAFRDALPEKVRLAVAAAESRQSEATGAVDAKVAKLASESDKLREFVVKNVSDTARNVQESRNALGEIRARSDELAAKLAGFSSSQAQFVQELSETVENKFADAQNAVDITAASLKETVAKFESAQADTLAGFEASQLQTLRQFEGTQAAKTAEQDSKLAEFVKKQADATAQFESQQTKMVSLFESKLTSSVTSFEATQSQMLAAFEAKQTGAFSALDVKQAEAIAALDRRQADLAAALEVRESQTTSAIDALRVGVAAQRAETEKTMGSLAERIGTLDAFYKSMSELLSTTKADVSTAVDGLRKEQAAEFAGMHASQGALSRTLQETDSRLSKTVSEGFVRSASVTEKLAASLTETGNAVASLRASLESRVLSQEKELAEVKAANAVLEKKVSSMLVAVEKVAALSGELDSQRLEMHNSVTELRAAFNTQAVAQVEDAQKQLAQSRAPEAKQEAQARQAALEANLSELEKAISELDSKLPASQQPQAAVARPQFIRPQPRVQQPAPQYAPQPRVQPQRYVPPQPQVAPQPRPRQDYYAPQSEQQRQQQPARPAVQQAVRQMPRLSRHDEVSSMGSGSADSAQTEADRQAMDLMAELRGKLLGGEPAQAAEKKGTKAADEKDKQQ